MVCAYIESSVVPPNPRRKHHFAPTKCSGTFETVSESFFFVSGVFKDILHGFRTLFFRPRGVFRIIFKLRAGIISSSGPFPDHFETSGWNYFLLLTILKLRAGIISSSGSFPDHFQTSRLFPDDFRSIIQANFSENM